MVDDASRIPDSSDSVHNRVTNPKYLDINDQKPAGAEPVETQSKSPSRPGSRTRSWNDAAASKQIDVDDSYKDMRDSGPLSAESDAGSQSESEPDVMSDEQLARSIALSDAFQAGRRRETRRSWNAGMTMIEGDGSTTIDEKLTTIIDAKLRSVPPILRLDGLVNTSGGGGTPPADTVSEKKDIATRPRDMESSTKVNAKVTDAILKPVRDESDSPLDHESNGDDVIASIVTSSRKAASKVKGRAGKSVTSTPRASKEIAKSTIEADENPVDMLISQELPRTRQPQYVAALAELGEIATSAKIRFVRARYAQHSRAMKTLYNLQRRRRQEARM